MTKKLLCASVAAFMLVGCDSTVVDERDAAVRSSYLSMEVMDWKKSYSNDRMASLVTIANDGSFYTASSLHMGSYSPTLKLFKTDSKGKETWSKRVSLDIGENKVLSLSFSAKIKVDKDENLLVVGTSMDFIKELGDDGKSHVRYPTQTHKAFFVKTNSHGEKLWEYSYEGGEVESFGKSFDIDSEGNYYICGVETYDSYKKRTFVVKLTADGKEEFVKHYPLGGDLVSKNSIIVSGSSFYILGNSSHTVVDGNIHRQTRDIGMIKATLAGEQVWEKSYEVGDFNFSLAGFTQDSQKNLLIATTRGSVDLSNNDIKMYIVKVGEDGNKIWTQSFGTDKGESALDIETDSQNNVFVSGWTRGAFSGYTNEHDRDPFIAKFSTSGKMLKVAQFDALEGSSGTAISIDNKDAVYLSGFGKLTGESKYSFLIKYK
jgi:hypothetical protein